MLNFVSTHGCSYLGGSPPGSVADDAKPLGTSASERDKSRARRLSFLAGRPPFKRQLFAFAAVSGPSGGILADFHYLFFSPSKRGVLWSMPQAAVGLPPEALLGHPLLYH